VHRLLHSRGGLIIVFARYVPGGRSTTAFAAGAVHYPGLRFRWYTALGVLIWATEAALLGYLGGTLYADRPLVGLALGWSGALVISGLAVAANRINPRPDRTSVAAPPEARRGDGGGRAASVPGHGNADGPQ
jgi:membrane protein DedA with SNARE-associated domain